MNYRMIKYTLGWLMIFEGAFFILPLITSFISRDGAHLSIIYTALICFAIGSLCIFKKPKTTTIYSKDGFVIVALSWILLSLLGALPFVFSGTVKSYVDALFETASGFSTTGASILSDIEAVPDSLLLWRSFTHWIGGMGVLVFIMAFLPLGGGQNMHIMRAESPGPDVSKLVPRVKHTAIILYAIYFVLTVIQFIILLISKMEPFEALNVAFSTAGTGGYSIKNDSFAHATEIQQIIVTVFMLVFSINFNSYYLILKLKFKEAINSEVRAFLLIVFGTIVAIAVNITSRYGSFFEALRHAAFTVSSTISTTGFSTENFDVWPTFSKALIIVIMIIGACAGSTGGGVKVSRLMIFIKGFTREIANLIHPKQVKRITIDDTPIDHVVTRSVSAYFACYAFVFALSLLLVSLDSYTGDDFTTAFTSIAATISNAGPGLNGVGPLENYSGFSDFSKIVLIFDMLAGRLELFPMLILFSPATFKKN